MLVCSIKEEVEEEGVKNCLFVTGVGFQQGVPLCESSSARCQK